MADRKPYVLWLPSWFPSRVSPYNGDFILRHAIAASLERDIFVVHAVKDPSISRTEYEFKHLNERCRVLIIYHPRQSKLRWLDRVLSPILYLWLQLKYIRKHIRENGRPVSAHVHITMRAGAVGLILKWLCGIPYVLSEQSTRFLEQDPRSYFRSGPLTRWLLKKVLGAANEVSAVSSFLAERMRQLGEIRSVRVIPNVVDGSLFQPSGTELPLTPFRLIHVSNLTGQKNPGLVLRAMEILEEEHPGAYRLTVIGPTEEFYRHKPAANTLLLPERDHAGIAELMQQHHALLLYSAYETFGCVLIEAMACGLPVVVTDNAVSREVVKEGVTGLMAAPDNPEQLARAIASLHDQFDTFNRVAIRESTLQQYNYRKVGAELAAMYPD